MATLYRKYRPQVFSEAVGQNHIKITLQNEISSNKTAHAYLFCGPRAVGKTTFARLFAKSINCLDRADGEFEPCDKCDSCLSIVNNKSLDIVEIDAASHTGVDNVRDNIIAGTRVSTGKDRYKIFIIDEVHMLSISAFNALLKTLEEPPANVIFILCTTEVHKMPATIISRCERFDFRRINIEDMVKKLSYIVKKEEIIIDKEILEQVARQSEGHMRDAESLLGQIVAISGKEITREDADLVIPRSNISEVINLIEILFKKDTASGIALVNKLLDDGVNLEKFISDFIEVLRKILLGKINPALEDKLGLDIGESFEMKINEIKKDIDINRLIIVLERFIEAKVGLKSSFIIQLPIELAICELCLDNEIISPRQPIPETERKAPIFNTQVGEVKNISNPIKIVEEPAVKSISKQTVSKIDKTMLLSKWNEFLVKIKKYNHSLSFILRVCQPREINGDQICLVFKYKFHKDRINDVKIKEIVQSTLKEVYGLPLFVEAIVDENLEITEEKISNDNGGGVSDTGNGVIEKESSEQEENKENNNMDDLLKTFGGKVIG